jgi:hypothetical protein
MGGSERGEPAPATTGRMFCVSAWATKARSTSSIAVSST